MKPLPKRLIGHALRHNPFQHAMLIARPGSIFSIHLFEVSRTIDNHYGSPMPSSEIRSGELIKLRSLNDFVNSATFFLAYTHPPHHVGKSLVTRLVSVYKPLDRYNRLTRIRNLKPVGVQLNHD